MIRIRDGGIKGLDPFQGFQAGDFEHPNIHQDQIVGLGLNHFYGDPAVIGLADVIPPTRRRRALSMVRWA